MEWTRRKVIIFALVGAVLLAATLAGILVPVLSSQHQLAAGPASTVALDTFDFTPAPAGAARDPADRSAYDTPRFVVQPGDGTDGTTMRVPSGAAPPYRMAASGDFRVVAAQEKSSGLPTLMVFGYSRVSDQPHWALLGSLTGDAVGGAGLGKAFAVAVAVHAHATGCTVAASFRAVGHPTAVVGLFDYDEVHGLIATQTAADPDRSTPAEGYGEHLGVFRHFDGNVSLYAGNEGGIVQWFYTVKGKTLKWAAEITPNNIDPYEKLGRRRDFGRGDFIVRETELLASVSGRSVLCMHFDAKSSGWVTHQALTYPRDLPGVHNYDAHSDKFGLRGRLAGNEDLTTLLVGCPDDALGGSLLAYHRDRADDHSEGAFQFSDVYQPGVVDGASLDGLGTNAAVDPTGGMVVACDRYGIVVALDVDPKTKLLGRATAIRTQAAEDAAGTAEDSVQRYLAQLPEARVATTDASRAARVLGIWDHLPGGGGGTPPINGGDPTVAAHGDKTSAGHAEHFVRGGAGLLHLGVVDGETLALGIGQVHSPQIKDLYMTNPHAVGAPCVPYVNC